MSKIEVKLQEVWGVAGLVFCGRCGVPAAFSRCGHDEVAAWDELDARQKARVRRQTIAKAKQRRSAPTVITAAS